MKSLHGGELQVEVGAALGEVRQVGGQQQRVRARQPRHGAAAAAVQRRRQRHEHASGAHEVLTVNMFNIL